MISLYELLFITVLSTIGFFVLYYCFFALIFFVVPAKINPRVSRRKKFLILIPAHNEEELLPSTLAQLVAVDYPKDLYAVVVVADNCDDSTARIAANHDVFVMERTDTAQRGKGFALSWALARLPVAEYHAVVIVDADTLMDAQYLAEMNASLIAGSVVIQGYNSLRNPEDSNLTRLMHVTNVLKNRLFNETKSRLGLSVALMGTGMCFDRNVLEKYGWSAHSVGEDWEYFANLTDRGIVVGFNPLAITYAQEATSLRQGFSQRIRWAGGKYETVVKFALPTLMRGVREFDVGKIDAALGIIAPPFSQLAYLSVFLLLFSLPGLFRENPSYWFTVAAALLLGLQIGYFSLGLFVMKASARTYISVIVSPLFLGWKLLVDLLALVGYRRKTWVRTTRSDYEKR